MKKHAFFICLFVCLVAVSAAAQQIEGCTYSVNFVCGKPDAEQLVKGYYLTAISVHNPTDQNCKFEKNFAVALPNQRPGPMTNFIEGRLGPYQAMEIDCPEIRDRLKKIQYEAEFLKGFVLIKSDVKLNVTAIYSAAGDRDMVESLHVEKIVPRCNSNDQNGSGNPNGCEPIPKEGQQCLWRVSKNAGIKIKRDTPPAYKCGTGATKKCRTEAIFTLTDHQNCDESSALIPDSSVIRVTGHEILRDDATGVFTGTFDLFNMAGNKLGAGDVYILSRVGTHRHPVSSQECESCDPRGHSEGYLCGKIRHKRQTYYLYCQIALLGWYPQIVVRAPAATFEGVLVK
jgi:hypothetical protein